MNVLQMNAYPFHIMFMPCSDEFKYAQRFKRLNWYICTHCPNLTSGLYDVDVFEPRECLHEAIGHENRILERNYRILGDIKGKEVIIVDDVLTTGQSMSDYKREIERCGGKVVAVIFYGKDYHYAASADCQVGGMGRLYYPLFQIKLVFFTVGLL